MPAREPGRLRRFRPYAALVVALVVTLVGRILLFDWWISPDESGFLLVAHGLGEGDNLYGRYWVDRPPTLIWLFALGDLLGGIEGVRVLVGAWLLGFVALVHVAARRMGGSPAWALVVAVPIISAPVFAAQVANGETFAIPLVMASVVAGLLAARRGDGAAYPRPHVGPHIGVHLWAFVAGLVGMLAMTVKQNFAEGLVFAFVLLLVEALRRERPWAQALRLMLAGLAGALVTCLVMVAHALTTPAGLHGLWVAAISFRTKASDVLHAGPTDTIDERRGELVAHTLHLGIIPLLVVLLVVVLWSRLRGSAVAWAVGALLAVELVGVVLGGNFWPHYVLGLAPGLALATGLAARRVGARVGVGWRDRPTWPTWGVRLVAAYLAVALLIGTAQDVREEADAAAPRGVTVGTWVADSAGPKDTATSLYGLAYTQAATGMDSPYRHLWSLPVRVLDPDLDELTRVLAGKDAPTWLLLTFSVHAWGLDPEDQVNEVVTRRYERVLDDCHMYVYKLKSARRHLAPPPTC